MCGFLFKKLLHLPSPPFVLVSRRFCIRLDHDARGSLFNVMVFTVSGTSMEKLTKSWGWNTQKNSKKCAQKQLNYAAAAQTGREKTTGESGQAHRTDTKDNIPRHQKEKMIVKAQQLGHHRQGKCQREPITGLMGQTRAFPVEPFEQCIPVHLAIESGEPPSSTFRVMLWCDYGWQSG